MRYAVISDIHSNIEALEAFLKKAGTLKLDAVVCLGDIVGYNASPNECVEAARSWGMRCVTGNHDIRAAGLKQRGEFNLIAEQALGWTIETLTEANKEFLKGLPLVLSVDNGFLAVHGTIKDVDEYVLNADDARVQITLLKETGLNLCFFGHTHVPAVYVEHDGLVNTAEEADFKLQSGCVYLINPGSIGQPRDSDPRASFLVYDSKKAAVEFYRIDYDTQTAARKIIDAGLPKRLAERLRLGW